MTKIGSAFLPVRGPIAAAAWYLRTCDLNAESFDTGVVGGGGGGSGATDG